MKKLLSIVVLGLLLSGNAYAAKISDYVVVGGISVGDSAIDFYTKKELNDNYENWNEPKYGTSEIKVKKDDFDDIQLIYKSKDPEFKIEGISVLKYMNTEDCLKRLDDEATSIQEQFTAKEVKFYKKNKKTYAGKATITSIRMKFKSDKGVMIIACYDWLESYATKMGYNDNLRFSIRTKSYAKFLNNR